MLQSTHTPRPQMPEQARFLISDYPRETWPNHPNFAQKTQNWMGAHNGFRQLSSINKEICEDWIDKNADDEKLIRYLGHYGDLLIRNLHGHHSWEDRSFFPEIFAADPRAEVGLDTLESDHEELDQRLDDITTKANRVIKLATLAPKQIHEEIGELHQEFCALGTLLDRHLTDEKELIVPVILHYKLRG